MGLVAILIFHKAGAVILEPGSWILIPANAAVCASLLPSVRRRARLARVIADDPWGLVAQLVRARA